MQVWPAARIRVHAIVAGALALAGALGAGLGAWPWIGALVSAALGAVWYAAMAGRYHRRRALVASPFPEDWRRLLERRVDYYRDLEPDSEDRRRFEDDVRIFLAEQRIYGVGQGDQQLEVDDETRLLIASSAAILGHGMPRFEWPRMRDIVVYARSFDDDYGDGDGDDANISGMVHSQGPILYSARDLKLGYRRHDGHNVGLHELAHVLDLADGHADGVPVGAAWASDAPWLEVIHDRLGRLRRRRYKKVLRDYAATNEAEFFAVAVEAFFERPSRLRDQDPELYAMLRDYFGQDPAGVESARRRSPRKFR